MNENGSTWISELLLHYEFRYSYLLNVSTVRCSVVAIVVGSWRWSCAYGRCWCSAARHTLSSRGWLATGWSNVRINSKRCKFHWLVSYIVLLTYNAASINSKFAHIQCSISTLLDGLKMLLEVWVVLLLWLDKSFYPPQQVLFVVVWPQDSLKKILEKPLRWIGSTIAIDGLSYTFSNR